MAGSEKTVAHYLEELERNKKDKPDQVRDGMDVYLDLWRRAVTNGIVLPTDEMSEALSKLEKKGGLYNAAEG